MSDAVIQEQLAVTNAAYKTTGFQFKLVKIIRLVKPKWFTYLDIQKPNYRRILDEMKTKTRLGSAATLNVWTIDDRGRKDTALGDASARGRRVPPGNPANACLGGLREARPCNSRTGGRAGHAGISAGALAVTAVYQTFRLTVAMAAACLPNRP